jgi:hypothetical protein
MWMAYKWVKGPENNVITRTRRRLLDPTHFDLTAPRCYLYSCNDTLIAWQDVHEHAEDSAQTGVPVTEVLFKDSGHVGHMRQEPNRYWSAVMATWDSASASSEEKSGVTVVVVDFDKQDFEEVGKEKRWSDVDSQRTLLPNLSARAGGEKV